MQTASTICNERINSDPETWQSQIVGPKAMNVVVFADQANAKRNGTFPVSFDAQIKAAFEVQLNTEYRSVEAGLGWRLAKSQDTSILRLESDDLTLFQVNKFVVGNSIYPFRASVSLAILKDCRVVVPYPLSETTISGRGKTVEEALQDFKTSFHVRFQQLLKMSTLTMNQEELDEWGILSSLVDVEEHKRLTPIELRKIGSVVSLSPFLLQWLEADEPIPFDLAKAPAKLASFSIGDEFEAVVEFNRGTREITRILSVGCTPEAITSNGDPDETETIAPVDWSDL